MKSNIFTKKLQSIAHSYTLYELGRFGNKNKGKYVLYDCSGLIKGALWGYPENGKYVSNGVPDVNANTMITKCSSITTDISKAEKGWLLWMDGHVGISLGNGYHVESTPAWSNGVQIIATNRRNWKKTGKLPWIDYSKVNDSYYPKCNYTGISIVDGLKSINVDSSIKNRRVIAEKNDIKNYQGLGYQNLEMLDLLKKGKLKR